MRNLEEYFSKFGSNVVGNNTYFNSEYGNKKILYADWIASGRLYKPIEDKLLETFGPFVANTHTETSETGTKMTQAYHYAHKYIKKHVNASEEDVIITAGFGMTAVVNKLQRILGLKACKHVNTEKCMAKREKPVVFITHMEHHSNHTSWLETLADVVQIKPTKDLLVDLNDLEEQLKKYKDRSFKIGSFTACSNVTGIVTPYHKMAKLMHQYNGLCFVDFAASAPYVDMNMHPKDPMEKLDAIFFSPHKFLGGPGSSGVLIFDSAMYDCSVPDNPGGGTVDWTNPWGKYKYLDNIEMREDGGTPGFLQAFRTALAIELKTQMGTENIEKREKELVEIAFREFKNIKGMKILADNIENRLGVISFYFENIHYNLLVKILSDRFGIQVRGGCACAGTYGHFLLDVSYEHSKEITDKINLGDLSDKPGWVRLSLHQTMKNEELYFIADAIKQISERIKDWKKDYTYIPHKNEFVHNSPIEQKNISEWFKLD
ncbi:MAG: aminotransferase class V-fold PLP-dependent enzyme [Bacteroidetes bacterium]|jgi:selenocysteine lyase/cysteine desulfurase|nr:aminotransferase class V-fold PLP-dependent enzyme [Bacteroidota bacterium]MBT6686044.1 aminotransferase class V-fold PLP-dependent enzyme [Bacteroidota bacterium]MBT7142736.1 aminotransferase class V-fold PLP-dependent enzyme [Bacteroidota bacterium]MBT7491323.1 aminotransferase class V-fold PLP-dependent enzyme [Bacteroidota bacterium]